MLGVGRGEEDVAKGRYLCQYCTSSFYWKSHLKIKGSYWQVCGVWHCHRHIQWHLHYFWLSLPASRARQSLTHVRSFYHLLVLVTWHTLHILKMNILQRTIAIIQICITLFCILGIINACLNSCFRTVLHLSDLSEQLRGTGKAVIDYFRSDYRSFSYWEFDVKRYINSQPDKEEAADTVLKASLPFLKSDECERVWKNNSPISLMTWRMNVCKAEVGDSIFDSSQIELLAHISDTLYLRWMGQ